MSQGEISERLSTGIQGLDTVLRGGLVKGSVYIVQGAPGVGKTILANQACFEHARAGGQAVYFTLLSESHDRLIRHMEKLSFFQENLVNSSVYFECAFDTLEQEGVDGVLKLISTESQKKQVGLVVVDGLFVIEEYAADEKSYRRFFCSLSAMANILNAPILLVTNSRRTANSPEFTIVDGWMEMGYIQHDYRVMRFVQVHKIRGSDLISGRHNLTITDRGIEVLPRLESLPADQWPARDRSRLSTGNAELDAMLHGGIVGGATTLVVGPTGVGKTTVGLQYMLECTEDEPGLVFSFYENEQDFREKARMLDMDFDSLIDRQVVHVHWQPAVESTLDELGSELLKQVKQRKVKRLFIDGVDALQTAAIYPERLPRFLTALTSRLRANGVTAMFTLEIPELSGGEFSLEFGPVSAVAENIIMLRYVEIASEIQRSITMMKARHTEFDHKIRIFRIASRGLRIDEPLARAAGESKVHPDAKIGG